MAKKKGKSKQKNTSSLAQHKKQGSKLIPPFLQYPNSQFMSWPNERLPEVLWAALLVTHLPRELSLRAFRKAADYIFRLPKPDKFHSVNHSDLAKLKPEQLEGFILSMTDHTDVEAALSSLLLLDNLPGREVWEKALGNNMQHANWEYLMAAVGTTFGHQTQEATDCRWMRLVANVAGGKFKFPLDQMAREILEYPNFGDQRGVRPTIRSLEMSLSMMPDASSDWPDQFWDFCLDKTPCFPLDAIFQQEEIAVSTTLKQITRAYDGLAVHFQNTLTTTSVNPKHDSVFGFGFYALAILEDVFRVGNRDSITGRSALRTLVEIYITLSYLVKKDDPSLWKTYRSCGAGQAKLALLKFEEGESSPRFTEMETLDQLANEDAWQEFVEINLGNWENLNLRKMSEDAGVKDDYDRFYPWPSHYSHAQWGAVRDTVFETCGNPLHRFHRIPRKTARLLPSVLPDACELVDKILALISTIYPRYTMQVSMPSDEHGVARSA